MALRKLHLALLVGIVLISGIDVSSQTDFSSVFPEIRGCVRLVGPLKHEGKVVTQQAVYEVEGFERFRENPNYFGCGSIDLRYEPRLKKSAFANYDWLASFPTSQRVLVQGYDAMQSGPQCGNDSWIGAIAVYFTNDAVLTGSANVPGVDILKFAYEADYKKITATVRNVVR